jgi:hypothetical protein
MGAPAERGGAPPSQLYSFRPAMTPPLTSQIAPVTQPALGEEEEGDRLGDVLGSADPADRVESVEALQRAVHLRLGMNAATAWVMKNSPL